MSLYLTLHFSAVIFYASPGDYFGKMKSYVFPYMYPYFHQSWSLFVPVPKENFNVYVKVHGEKWEDVFQNVVRKHQSNRLGGNEDLMLAFSNGLMYYALSASETNAIITDDASNVNFEVIKKLILQFYKIKSDKVVEEIIIVCRNIKGTPYYAHYYKINS